MPANKTRDTLARQWELLKMLPAIGAGKTVRQLTDELNALSFSVGVRQIERDLKQLQGLMPIECNDTGQPHGWRWIKGASRHIAAMSLPEAVSWQLVSDTVKPLLPLSILSGLEPHFREAQDKLNSLTDSHSAARWTQKIRVVQPSLPLISPTIIPSVLEQVQQALLNHQQIEVSYRKADATKAQDMTLHPLALVQRGSVSYLVATTFHFKELRLFVLHRIEKAVLLEETVSTLEGFNIDSYIASGALHFGNGKIIQLEIRVERWLKNILQETPLSTDQQVTDADPLFIITATVADTSQLQWWILSQAEALEVLQPVWLREKIKERLIKTSQHYFI
jgi:predicted DNA-binding transcriptional regulator YafY